MTAGRIVRKIWWKNQQFFPVDIIPPWFSILIYTWGMNNRHVDGHSSQM
jgi:hypothetical protein